MYCHYDSCQGSFPLRSYCSIQGHIFCLRFLHLSKSIPDSFISLKLHLGMFICSWCSRHPSAWSLRITIALGKVPFHAPTIICYKLRMTIVLVCLWVHILSTHPYPEYLCNRSGIVIMLLSQMIKLHQDDPTHCHSHTTIVFNLLGPTSSLKSTGIC